MLVGGLGLGFTLAEVLADPRVERVTVVEIEPALVGWLRDGTIPHGPGLLADPARRRRRRRHRATRSKAEEAAYDLVLLDVDNGPRNLVHDSNAALYDDRLSSRPGGAMRPEGVCVVWSADRDAALDAALRRVFGNAEELDFDVDLQGRAERYWLHLARRDGG